MSRPPERRFAGRATDYERGRPGYPEALFDALVGLAGIASGDAVADVGSGTGLSAAPLLRRGFVVHAIEPEPSMRAAAAARLAAESGFRQFAGEAAATGLADASVALVLIAQAFHWFEAAAARREFRRILRPGGAVALVWNARRARGTPFAEAYERLLLEFGIDYLEVGHRGVGGERLSEFFGGGFTSRRYFHAQRLDSAALRARLLSSSYVPAAGEPRHGEMLARLDELFAAHTVDGAVELHYDAELHFGPLAAAG